MKQALQALQASIALQASPESPALQASTNMTIRGLWKHLGGRG